jgi:RNA polymerase sigma-70 factor (ECF subfamily)
VAARRPQAEVDRRQQQEVVARFLAAVRTGDLQALMDVLAPDAVLIADGGGVVQAVLHPVVGAKKICNLVRSFPKLAPTGVLEPMQLNGTPGARLMVDGQLDTVLGFAFENGRISRIFTVRNPSKLGRVVEETSLSR